MNGAKIFGTVLAVLLVAFAFTSTASAQTNVDILGGQWFKANLNLKGYTIADDGETVLGKGAGSKKPYLHFVYDDVNRQYTITTCMQDDVNDNIWYQNTSDPIPIGIIYGATYPQVWDLGPISLQFEDGFNTFSIYPTFYTKVKVVGDTLKSASITNVVCTLNAKLEGGEYATGSCILNGPLVPENKVPAACLVPPPAL